MASVAFIPAQSHSYQADISTEKTFRYLLRVGPFFLVFDRTVRFGSVVRSNQEFGEVRSGSVVRSNRGFTEPNRTSKKCTIQKKIWVTDEKYFEFIFGKS